MNIEQISLSPGGGGTPRRYTAGQKKLQNLAPPLLIVSSSSSTSPLSIPLSLKDIKTGGDGILVFEGGGSRRGVPQPSSCHGGIKVNSGILIKRRHIPRTNFSVSGGHLRSDTSFTC